jgi:rare lipoprotein A
MNRSTHLFVAAACALAFAAQAAPPQKPAAAASASTEHADHPASQGKQLDRTGKRRVGKASIYARKFSGRTMADGTPMQPHDDNAASKTLPLGTTAKVTNLETGKSATVTIQDRGPHVPGRIVDLSPATAAEIGLSRKEGLAPVEVTPIEVPLPDGSVKLGEAAR